jgi:hypothetical protein
MLSLPHYLLLVFSSPLVGLVSLLTGQTTSRTDDPKCERQFRNKQGFLGLNKYLVADSFFSDDNVIMTPCYHGIVIMLF